MYDKLKDYSKKTKVPMSAAVNEAIQDFVDTVVPARLEAFEPVDIRERRMQLAYETAPVQA